MVSSPSILEEGQSLVVLSFHCWKDTATLLGLSHRSTILNPLPWPRLPPFRWVTRQIHVTSFHLD